MKKTSAFSFMTLGICAAFSLSVKAQLINEGFEGAFPPTGWTVNNPDGLKTFESASVGKTGSKSAFIDIFNSDANGAEKGQADALISSAVDLSSVSSPTFTFYYAYQMFTDPATYTTADAINVYISTDGGTTWTSVYNKTGNTLITAATQFNASAGYVPTSSEWVMETVDISTYAAATNAQFKIEFVNDWENNFYIDDILVTGGSLGVSDVNSDASVSVFPNPSHGNVTVNHAASGLGQADVVIYNTLGENADHISYKAISPKRVEINLQDLPNGVYFVNVKTGNGSTTKKLILNK